MWPHLLAVACTLVCLAPGQRPDRRQQQPDEARRLARELELPDRRPDAADRLVALGAPAVPALLQQVRHPDLRVARIACEVLAALRHDALAAVPELTHLAKGDTPHAQAAAWTLARLPHRGTFLVPSMQDGTVCELDADGRELWSRGGFGQPWHASMLANGNLLLATMQGAREVDPEGNVVWQFDLAQVYTAERLVDGNTLLASFGGRQVVEVNPAGDVVWSHDVAALFATRLPNGRTLLCEYNAARVHEVDRAGTVAWSVEDCPHPFACERLRDGSTRVLFQQPGKAVRWDREGRKLDELELGRQCLFHIGLPDGALFAGNRFVRRVDRDGKDAWRFELAGWAGRVTLR
jgi:hypothetical protein